jgi:hypothetical protein
MSLCTLAELVCFARMPPPKWLTVSGDSNWSDGAPTASREWQLTGSDFSF